MRKMDGIGPTSRNIFIGYANCTGFTAHRLIPAVLQEQAAAATVIVGLLNEEEDKMQRNRVNNVSKKTMIFRRIPFIIFEFIT
jgi:hypothetical protein